MSFKFHKPCRAAALAALTVLSSQVLAQSDDGDLELRIQRLENQLRQLTGQNEELQYRNRQLEERLRQLQVGAGRGPGQPGAEPSVAGAAQVPPAPSYGQPQLQPRYGEPQPPPPHGYIQPHRGDAFDPSQNPNAPGAPRPLGGGQLTIPADASVGAPGGRAPGEPLNLANTANAPRYPQVGLPSPPPNGTGAPVTAPPSNSPRDEFDLGIGYMQRRDYALAEQTMRNFAQKFPSDPLVGDSQFWVGESYFQRQQYRDAAEAFLGVTTKYEKSSKAPDALLRLGQSLAALKEKEAACAAFGEATRKYPRASAAVKAAVDREQKKEKC